MTDIETSNSQDPVDVTETAAPSAVEHVNENQDNNASHGTPEANAPTESEPSLADKMREKAKSLETDKHAETEKKENGPENQNVQPEPPKYQPNFKYRAFGKEKELDPFWQGLVKDPESEKRVKEVFTRADAFDDMKGRYESASVEGQKTLQQFTALDRDVRRVTNFLNKGDTDNFFRSLNISDDMLLEHLQRKAEISKLSPLQQNAYSQGVDARAQNLYQQESYDQLQQNFATQQAQYRQVQLDTVLLRPEVNSAASTWDQKMGLGSFRQLVIEEAANMHRSTGQDLAAENAVDMVLKKFGKLLSPEAMQNASAQTGQQFQQAPQNYNQAQPQPGPNRTVVVQGKPVIPNVNGRGTSPVKKAPQTLDELRKMGQAARMAEAQYQEANI